MSIIERPVDPLEMIPTLPEKILDAREVLRGAAALIQREGWIWATEAWASVLQAPAWR